MSFEANAACSAPGRLLHLSMLGDASSSPRHRRFRPGFGGVRPTSKPARSCPVRLAGSRVRGKTSRRTVGARELRAYVTSGRDERGSNTARGRIGRSPCLTVGMSGALLAFPCRSAVTLPESNSRGPSRASCGRQPCSDWDCQVSEETDDKQRYSQCGLSSHDG
jgi:hypothetical protein